VRRGNERTVNRARQVKKKGRRRRSGSDDERGGRSGDKRN
jgi:hypothetical protein